MPTLLQINTTLNIGSHGRIAEHLSCLVLDRGWNSYFAYGRDMQPSRSIQIKIGNSVDVKWHVLMTRLFDAHGLYSKKATKKFIEKIGEIKPDIIHLHNIHGYYLNYPLLFEYFSRSNIPIVWTFHDCWPMTGHCSNSDNIGCTLWKTECHNCPLKSKDYPQSYLLDMSRRNFKLKKKYFTSLRNLHIVTVSRWLQSVVNNSFFKTIPNRVIYNGIDLDIFKPRLSLLKEELGLVNKFVILGVSNVWWPIKGYNDFIKLSSELDKDCCIVLIGVDQETIKSLPTNVVGVSKTTNQIELAQYYSMADVLLSLSYQETFGLTIAEALACGTPAVVYNRTATPEIIDKNTGIVAEAGNINSILTAINTIKKNGKGFYSVACRQRAIEFYNKDDRYQDYINLYNELLNEKSCSR